MEEGQAAHGRSSRLGRQVILLAYEDSFVASYIECVLQRSGAEVVGLASLDEPPAGSQHNRGIVAYVVGQRHGTAVRDHITRQGKPRPALLLIGTEPSVAMLPRSATLHPPFAAYQVADAIAHLLDGNDAAMVAEPAPDA